MSTLRFLTHDWAWNNRWHRRICMRCGVIAAGAQLRWCGKPPWITDLHFDPAEVAHAKSWLGSKWFYEMTRGPMYESKRIFPEPPKPHFIYRDGKWKRP